MAGPSAGVKVLQISNWVADFSACAILAELGAQVAKVEDPDTGDPVHSFKLFSEGDVRYTGGINTAFQQVSRVKASVAINLQVPLGQEVVRRMTARSGC